MNKLLLYSLFILLVCLGVTFRFSTSHEEMPIGCDEFGYLNQAKAMDEGLTFTQHTTRPYLKALLDTLRSTGISEQEIAWMITPHAYHLIPETNKIINQYPPGTAFVLQLFPLSIRKILFPFVTILLLLMLPLIAVSSSSGNSMNWFHPVFALFVFIVTVSAPFLTELTRVNSVSLTFGFLLAAGILLNKFPWWSCFLIALTINFRTANVLMVIPVFFFLQPSLKQLLTFKNIILFAGLVALALLPLLFYNYQVLGNPFSTTYSSIDKAFTISPDVIEAVTYYFSWDQYWFRVHLIAVSLILILGAIQKCDWKFVLKCTLFPIVNYLFFFYHEVRMDYYPYASSMILLGTAFGMLSEFKMPDRFHKWAFVGMFALAIFIFSAGISRYMKREHMTWLEAKNKYEELCKYHVVWGDLYSGTSEYVCNNSGFRYGTSTPRARRVTMIYLQQHQFSQAILLDDNTVDPELIISEVKEAGLDYKTAIDPVVGNYLIIR